MKKYFYNLFCLLSFITLISSFATATTHIITVTDFQFSPDTMTVASGDTVTWQWQSGFHTTTANGIPEGAEQWNELLDSLHTSFTYVVTVAGTYHYISVPDLPTMTGTFTLPGLVGIDPLNNSLFTFAIEGNLVQNQINISYSSAINVQTDIALYNLSGIRLQTLLHENIPTGKHENIFALLEDFPVGMYLVIMRAENVFLTRKIVIQ
ncbi:MAG: T9SS type A sorting domain-containing protein [Chitinophagales bacterium]